VRTSRPVAPSRSPTANSGATIGTLGWPSIAASATSSKSSAWPAVAFAKTASDSGSCRSRPSTVVSPVSAAVALAATVPPSAPVPARVTPTVSRIARSASRRASSGTSSSESDATNAARSVATPLSPVGIATDPPEAGFPSSRGRPARRRTRGGTPLRGVSTPVLGVVIGADVTNARANELLAFRQLDRIAQELGHRVSLIWSGKKRCAAPLDFRNFGPVRYPQIGLAPAP